MDFPLERIHNWSFWEGYLFNSFGPSWSFTFHISLIDKDKLGFNLETFLRRALVPDWLKLMRRIKWVTAPWRSSHDAPLPICWYRTSAPPSPPARPLPDNIIAPCRKGFRVSSIVWKVPCPWVRHCCWTYSKRVSLPPRIGVLCLRHNKSVVSRRQRWWRL